MSYPINWGGEKTVIEDLQFIAEDVGSRKLCTSIDLFIEFDDGVCSVFIAQLCKKKFLCMRINRHERAAY